MSSYGGWVKDKKSGAAIPRATVESWFNNKLIQRVIASDSGYFTISAFLPATHIRVSSAGYKTRDFPADIGQMLYDLERNVIELPPVVIPPGPKKNKTGWLIYALLGLLLITAVNKK